MTAIAAALLLLAAAVWVIGAQPQSAALPPPRTNAAAPAQLAVAQPSLAAFERFTAVAANPFVPWAQRQMTSSPTLTAASAASDQVASPLPARAPWSPPALTTLPLTDADVVGAVITPQGRVAVVAVGDQRAVLPIGATLAGHRLEALDADASARMRAPDGALRHVAAASGGP